MHHLVLLLIGSIPFAKGLSNIGPNDVYNLVNLSSIDAKVGEQCRESLKLYVKNLENNTSDDQWALQSEYITRMPRAIIFSLIHHHHHEKTKNRSSVAQSYTFLVKNPIDIARY